MSTTSAAPGEVCVRPYGEIDLATAPEVRACLIGALSHPSCATLILDLRAVSYLNIRGAAMLADISDRAADRDVQMIVVANTVPVLRPLQKIGADGGVFASVAAARAGTDLVSLTDQRGADRD